MNKSLKQFNLLRSGEEVTAVCYIFDDNVAEHIETECSDLGDSKPDSAMWYLPFGYSLSVGLPLSFDLDAGKFPLEIDFDGNGNDAVQLELNLSMDLAFGLDDKLGFFFFTGESEEIYIEAVLSILNANVTASLLFLKGTMTDIDLQVGLVRRSVAGISIYPPVLIVPSHSFIRSFFCSFVPSFLPFYSFPNKSSASSLILTKSRR
jgi:hypothetical protein